MTMNKNGDHDGKRRQKEGRKRRGKERRMKNMTKRTKRDRTVAKAIIRCDAMREGDEKKKGEQLGKAVSGE